MTHLQPVAGTSLGQTRQHDVSSCEWDAYGKGDRLKDCQQPLEIIYATVLYLTGLGTSKSPRRCGRSFLIRRTVGLSGSVCQIEIRLLFGMKTLSIRKSLPVSAACPAQYKAIHSLAFPCSEMSSIQSKGLVALKIFSQPDCIQHVPSSRFRPYAPKATERRSATNSMYCRIS